MSRKILVTDEKYRGQYVALKSFTENTVVSYGHNPSDVIKQAVEKGINEPVIVFVPKKDATCIY